MIKSDKIMNRKEAENRYKNSLIKMTGITDLFYDFKKQQP